jgi:hypothetical protein
MARIRRNRDDDAALRLDAAHKVALIVLAMTEHCPNVFFVG